ncbi:MAG: hypothetical protein L0196_07055 [candidate division Zixibacteria bacterium]|nr:hypothetical protein [candidate division Zixibacteria bacterium]
MKTKTKNHDDNSGPRPERWAAPILAYDAFDLAACIGALQLVPENADRTLRLETAGALIASLKQDDTIRPPISSRKLDAWLNGPPFATDIAWAEDPFDSLFAEEVTFYGGSYTVFPGIAEESSFIIRHLAKAIFLSEETFPHEQFRREVYEVIRFTLALSNEIARKSNLSRKDHPVEAPGGNVQLPRSARFRELKRAVTFTQQELTQLFSSARISDAALNLLTGELGSIRFSASNIEDGPFFAKPIIRRTDRYAVAAPFALLSALRHAIFRLARQHNVTEALANRYHAAVRDTVRQTLSFFHPKELFYEFTAPKDLSGIASELFFQFDSDKLLHVLLLTDDLTHYNEEEVFGRWSIGDNSEKLTAHLEHVEKLVFSNGPAPNNILHLVIIQGIGRWLIAGFDASGNHPVSYVQFMTAENLQTIALGEGGDPLLLWHYAQASHEIRRHCSIRTTNTLDEFYFYRKNHFSYYTSDKARPTTLLIAPGSAGLLRREIHKKRDFHGTDSYNENRVAEVTLLHSDISVPIYAPWPPTDKQLAILVEGLPINVWITASEDVPRGQYRQLHWQFMDMVAYWMWQLTAGLGPHLQGIVGRLKHLRISLKLSDGVQWFENPGQETPDEMLKYDLLGRSHLRVSVGWSVAQRLRGADNAGERAILRELLNGFSMLSGGSLSVAAIDELLNTYAPLGAKKKLFFYSTVDNPILVKNGLPRERLVQAVVESQLLDEVGTYLSSQSTIRVGKIADSERTSILDIVVKDLFDKLENVISTLSPDGLMDWLVAYNERLVYEQEFTKFTTPTRIACFEVGQNLQRDIAKEQSDLAKAALASRFLIEYVAARPPRGVRPMSLAMYDYLLGIAAEIENWGTLSDLIHLKLADITLDVLPSARLGVDQEHYRKAQEAFLGEFAAAEVVRSTKQWERTWRKSDSSQNPSEAEALEAAVKHEFGFSLSELVAFLSAMIRFGNQAEGEPKTSDRGALITWLKQQLTWNEEQLAAALKLFSLGPRDSFLDPHPYRREEVYPWRFNREVSYLRRPLVLRETNGKTEVLWGNRHTYRAIGYLTGLCLGGRLRAQTKEMTIYLNKFREREAKQFNDQVAELCEKIPGAIVRKRVKKIDGLPIEYKPGQSLGDIDVLVIIPKYHEIVVIEAKDLAAARTPWEMAKDLRELFHPHNGKKSTVEKHQERAKWTAEHIREVLASSDQSLVRVGRWKVTPLIVLDTESLATYLVKSPVRVVYYRQLEDLLLRRN